MNKNDVGKVMAVFFIFYACVNVLTVIGSMFPPEIFFLAFIFFFATFVTILRRIIKKKKEEEEENREFLKEKEMIITCHKCGKKYNARNHYCPNCYTETDLLHEKSGKFDTYDDEDASIQCPKCHRLVTKKGKYCKYCGTIIDGDVLKNELLDEDKIMEEETKDIPQEYQSTVNGSILPSIPNYLSGISSDFTNKKN